MLRVWGRRSAFNVKKVFWLIGELQLPHEHFTSGEEFGDLGGPGFWATKSHGRVPVIDDDCAVVWESQVILRYLGSRYGQPTLWPVDALLRSRADRWMDWAHTTIEQVFLMGDFWRFFRTPEDLRNWSTIGKEMTRFSDHLRLLNSVLARSKFLAGDAFTLGDIPAGTALHRYFELDIKGPDIPMVERWYRLLQARPAFREHVMLPLDGLLERL
jgi:glutathione S-transferase